MKKFTLSELKQLKNVKEIKDSKTTDMKGGEVYILCYETFIDCNISSNLGFIPPPGL